MTQIVRNRAHSSNGRFRHGQSPIKILESAYAYRVSDDDDDDGGG